MNVSDMLEKYGVTPATLADHPDWVGTPAREIDLDKEIGLAVKLDKIMQYFMGRYHYVGVSSNNIFWNLTVVPIRIIRVPVAPGKYQTLINPRYLVLAGREMNHVEACGSISTMENYVVKRKPYVRLSGFSPERRYLELEFGSREYNAGRQPVLASFSRREWIVQHEMDHLDGITIKDDGTLFDFNSLISSKAPS